jgi:hypothetical protein
VGSEPLEAHLSDFWEAGEEMDEITIRVTPPPVPGAILKRLGPVPLVDLPEEWNGDLSRMYEVVSRDALAFVHASGKVPRAPMVEPEILNGSNGAQPEEVEEPDPALADLPEDGEDASSAEDGAEGETPALSAPEQSSNEVGALAVDDDSEPEGALGSTDR